MSEDDRQLIAECLGGRREAFGELVSRYQARLYNAAMRLVDNHDDAADVVQDSFLNAFQRSTPSRATRSFYLVVPDRLQHRDQPERKKRARVSLDGSGPEALWNRTILPSTSSPARALERNEEERQLQDAMNRLSHEHREVIVLKEIEGLKYEDIAEILGVPIGTIRSRLHRARLELRDLLQPED